MNGVKICRSSCSGETQYIIEPNECVSSCSLYYNGNICVSICPSNFYITESNGSKVCVLEASCTVEVLRINTYECMDSCPDGMFAETKICSINTVCVYYDIHKIC